MGREHEHDHVRGMTGQRLRTAFLLTAVILVIERASWVHTGSAVNYVPTPGSLEGCECRREHIRRVSSA